VPRTDQFAIVDDAGSERTATMGTDVIHGGELTVHTGDANQLSSTIEFLSFAFVRQVGNGSDAGQHE
jgi:hypothetical protein